MLFLYLFSAYNSAMFLRDSFTAGTVTFIDLLLSQLNDINSICFAVMLPFLLLILSDETSGERVLTSIKRGALISAIALMLLIIGNLISYIIVFSGKMSFAAKSDLNGSSAALTLAMSIVLLTVRFVFTSGICYCIKGRGKSTFVVIMLLQYADWYFLNVGIGNANIPICMGTFSLASLKNMAFAQGEMGRACGAVHLRRGGGGVNIRMTRSSYTA